MPTTTTKTKGIRSLAQGELYQFGQELLLEKPLMKLSDFEHRLFRKMRGLLQDQHYEVLQGQTETTGRKLWQNMIDWVKARLTQNGLIQYLDIRGERYLYYLDLAGRVMGVPLVKLGDTRTLVTLLANVANEQPKRPRPTTPR